MGQLTQRGPANFRLRTRPGLPGPRGPIGPGGLLSAASLAEALAGTDDTKAMTPLKASQAVAATTVTVDGDGAMPRPFLNKLRESRSVTDFRCADGSLVNPFDANQDHTMALQRAWNAAYEVRMPTGGTLNVTAVTLPAGRSYFAARGSSFIRARDNVSTLITMGPNCHLEGTIFDSLDGVTARPGGRYIDIPASSPKCSLQGVEMFHGFNGLRNAADLTRVNGIVTRDFHSGRYVFEWLGGYLCYVDEFLANNDIGQQPLSNFAISGCADLTVTRSNLCQGGIDMLVNPGSGQMVTSLKVVETYLDTANGGFKAIPTGTGEFTRSSLRGAWCSGHSGNGAELDGRGLTGTGKIAGISFDFPEFNGNANNGLAIRGSRTTNITWRGGEAAGNFCALNVDDGASRIRVGAKAIIGPQNTFGPNGYAMYGGTGDDVWVDETVDARGNTVGFVTGGLTNALINART